jgi:hypothetical protein
LLCPAYWAIFVHTKFTPMNKPHIVTPLFCLALFILLSEPVLSQTAPPARLKYFGFAFVDCGIDDPNDVSLTTNYTAEVDSFSNIAELHFDNYTDTIIGRVNLMNAHCMRPILSTSSVFLYLANSNGPSGSNYDLYPDYLNRWNIFKTINASVLNAGQIEMIYVCDEPTWNGVTFGELDTICSTIHADFPNIPLIFVEAYTEVANVQVPTSVTWIGFDHYGIMDVSTDVNYLGWLHTLESRRSTPDQRIMLVFDDEWNAGFWPQGWRADTIEQVLSHYYDLALADTNVIGLAGFTWPGIAPGWLGARSLPQHVIDKTVQIGQLIKANYDPCISTTAEENRTEPGISVYPNPAGERLNFDFSGDHGIHLVRIYNSFGALVSEISMDSDLISFPLNDLSSGIYFYAISNAKGHILDSGKFIKR